MKMWERLSEIWRKRPSLGNWFRNRKGLKNGFKWGGDEENTKGPWSRRLGWSVVGASGFLFFYYLVGMALVHEVEDQPLPEFTRGELAPDASRAVAVAAGLITREVDQHHWVANDPFFLPGAVLDNMPNFQKGIVSALGRFAFELTDQLGRTRGSSQADPDLAIAAGQLQYEGEIWLFDFKTSLLPTTPSDRRYRSARNALLRYNARLAAGEAVFARRSDNLLATLDRIALDLGSSSAVIDAHIKTSRTRLLDFESDDIFYSVKGQSYAYLLLLRALEEDFSEIIETRDLAASWRQMLGSFESAVALEPLLVLNGDPDGIYPPSHLAAEGFYLLRARTQLREITNILLK